MPQFLPSNDWIEKIIRIDSRTYRSNREIVQFLAPLLEQSGLQVSEQKVSEGGQTFSNLLAYSGDGTKDLLALNTHLDTVSEGSNDQWTKTDGDPFRATFAGKRVYGLGTADVKIDFLCKILAARNARPWKRPFVLVGTFGEERGLIGAMQLFQDKRFKPKYALVGEPSELELVYAHKGHLICQIAIDLDIKNVAFMERSLTKRWRGKAAHSSTPKLGKNALEAGLAAIFHGAYGIVRIDAGTDTNRVPDRCEAELVHQTTIGTERVFEIVRQLQLLESELAKKKDSRFSPSAITLSLNKARTEAGELLISFDIRTLPDTDAKKLETRLRRTLDFPFCRVVSLTQDPPLQGKQNSKFLSLLKSSLREVGVKPVLRTKASSTEAAIYHSHGAEAVVFGPGVSIGNVHRPNEYNLLPQIELATRFYTQCLMADSKKGR